MSGRAEGEWLVKFKGRNASGAYNQNFLWRSGNVYVMDNHRAAMWCWLQHVDPHKEHSLFHLDRHYDTLQSRLDEWLGHLPRSWNITIDDYLNHSYVPNGFDGKPVKIFNWGNYLSIYLACFGKSVKRAVFATHDDGDKPNYDGPLHVQCWDIPDNLSFWLDTKDKPWIMNVDLDYFFWHGDEPQLMVSDAYLQKCFSEVRAKLEDGTIAVLTIATTPDDGLTGGWTPSSELAEKVLGILGIEFKVPA